MIAGRELSIENDTPQIQNQMIETEGEEGLPGEMTEIEDQGVDRIAETEVRRDIKEEMHMTSQMMSLEERKVDEDLGHAHLTLIIGGSVGTGPDLPGEDAPTDHREIEVQTQTLLHLNLKKKQSRLRKRSHASSHQEFSLSTRTSSMASC